MRYILWFWRTKDSWPPTLFDFITLITYQFSLLPFACLACLCASLCSRTLVSPLTLPGVLTYQHTWFCLFAISFLSTVKSHQSIFIFFTKVFFNFPSPVSCLSLFTFHSTLHPSWLPSAACFTCLFAFLSPCVASVFFAAVRVSRTDEKSVRFRPPLSSTAPYPNAESKQVFEPPPPLLWLAIVSEREIVLQPFVRSGW